MLVDRSDGHFVHEGKCPICESTAGFKAHGLPLRSSFICLSCQSSPRERALIEVLGRIFPNWRDLAIHESSPGPMLSSRKLKQECPRYVPTEFDITVPFGTYSERCGCRSEDLERQTFDDESFDVVVTQDVFEHLFRPDLAIKEIYRTLRPGGAHICTFPIVNKERSSMRRAELVDGQVRHLASPVYHVNPINDQGSLVTVDWGFDVALYFSHHGMLVTTIFHLDDLEKGLRAELNEVLVCRKMAVPVI